MGQIKPLSTKKKTAKAHLVESFEQLVLSSQNERKNEIDAFVAEKKNRNLGRVLTGKSPQSDVAKTHAEKSLTPMLRKKRDQERIKSYSIKPSVNNNSKLTSMSDGIFKLGDFSRQAFPLRKAPSSFPLVKDAAQPSETSDDHILKPPHGKQKSLLQVLEFRTPLNSSAARALTKPTNKLPVLYSRHLPAADENVR